METKDYNYYLGKDLRKVNNEIPFEDQPNPINELHLHPINEASQSIKFPSGYRMAFSTLLHTDGGRCYLIKRTSS